MLLIERFLSNVAASPGAPAVLAGDQTITYRGLLALVSNAAGYLHGQGIGAGDTVALRMSQSPLHLIAFLALASLGAVVVPSSPFRRPASRAEIFRKYDLRTLVSDYPDAAQQGARLVPLQSVSAKGDESKLDFSGFAAQGASPLRISLTSGTTGTPRGTMQTHARLVQRLDRMQCREVEQARILPPNLHITSGLCQALHAICSAGAVVFPRAYDNEAFFDAIRRHGVTHVGLPPANLALMLAVLPDDGPAFPSIRQVRIVGGTPSAAFLDLARRRFSKELFVSYGLGEIGVVSMATPDVLLREPDSAGVLAPDIRFEVLDEAGRVLPRGSTGNVRVAFDGMATSYYGPDAQDRSRFRDGWFHPGDLARLSEDGLVFVEGRVDDIINVGGHKVSPRVVEALLEEFPGVREAAVFVDGVGIEGARMAAAIVAAGPLDLKALAAYGRAQLGVRAPVRYVEVEALPRNAMGKLVREGLADVPALNPQTSADKRK